MSYYKDSVDTIRNCDPAIKSNLEVLLYPCYWAILIYTFSHKLYIGKHYFFARYLSQVARSWTGIEIHPGAVIGKRLFIDHGMGVVIGETAVIGDDVIIYQGVTLGGTGKDIGKRHPTIGNNVLIGSGAKILGSFTVGDNARIGAGSVVLKAIPPNCTAVGVPAKCVSNSEVGVKNCNKLDSDNFPDIITSEIAELKLRLDKLENNRQK